MHGLGIIPTPAPAHLHHRVVSCAMESAMRIAILVVIASLGLALVPPHATAGGYQAPPHNYNQNNWMH